MHVRLSISAMVLLTTAVAGCTSFKAPERPAYTGTDAVASAQSSQLEGTWAVTALNPYPDTPPQTTTIEYRSDGTVIGEFETNGEGLEAFGKMEFEITGEWSLDGDTVIHNNLSVNSKNESGLGGLINKMMANQKALSGQANIYELSSDRIVMVGSDGDAMQYLRQ